MEKVNSFDRYCKMAFGAENSSVVFKLVAYQLFSREKDVEQIKREYKNHINFISHENYPSIIIYDEVEDANKATLFYEIVDIQEIPGIIKRNKIFVDNLKDNLLSNEDRKLFPYFFNTLDKIVENQAFNFEIIILINIKLSDTEIADLELKYSENPDVSNIGEFKIVDRKRLINKFNGENEENKTDNPLKFNFEFKNPANAETGKNNSIIYDERNSEKTVLLSLTAMSLIRCYQNFKIEYLKEMSDTILIVEAYQNQLIKTLKKQ
ncbi:hypothetical protein SCLARK_001298 [Spiroplasma clarkii]|uniref:hypothetical protein n=1 Tax=Spiroplasma clarkii TaxID=2139 RepID=UPI000B56F529|nr:hypothetical protein [Spiroplasma clarkii]ARU91834.1 hypothetical protein SCLARK_001298 [Spiroplasma clarkii]